MEKQVSRENEPQVVEMMDIEKVMQENINKEMIQMKVSKLYSNEIQAQKHATAANALLEAAVDLGLDFGKMVEAGQKVYEKTS